MKINLKLAERSPPRGKSPLRLTEELDGEQEIEW